MAHGPSLQARGPDAHARFMAGPSAAGVAGADRLDAAGCRHPAAGMTSSTVTAGFLPVLVSCAGALLIHLQAARAMGFDDAAFSPWVMAISVPAGVTGIALGLLTRAPIVTAWSAPGTVLLISTGSGMPFSDVVGANVVAALVILTLGVTGLFGRIVAAIPKPVAIGMIADVLSGCGLWAMGWPLAVFSRGKSWWGGRGSNPRPTACKAVALPLSYRPAARFNGPSA